MRLCWRRTADLKNAGPRYPPAGATARPTAEPPAPQNSAAPKGVNGSTKPVADRPASPPAHNNANGSAASSGFNQLRNEFLTAARRVATTKKQAVGEVAEWASGGVFKYGDVGRMTEADTAKLRAAAELMASTLAGAPR